MQFGREPRRPLTKAERDRQRVTRQIQEEVATAALMADGVVAFAGLAMERLNDLDQYRQELAGQDTLKNILFGEIEAQTVRQVKAIQRGLYNGMG